MRKVAYLMSGAAHTPYLVCSLLTLRNFWDGDVSIYAWPESFDIVKRIAEERRLFIKAVPREPAYRGKCDQFIDKIRVVMSLRGDADEVLYLDADTTVHGSIHPLFDAAAIHGFCATQFSSWVSSGSIPRSRVNCLLEFPEINREMIAEATRPGWPSLNGGVWAAKPKSPVLPHWHDWSMAARSTFIADEKVLHVLRPVFQPLGEMTILPGRYNCSPVEKYQGVITDDEVVIRHFHGDSNVRPSKSPKGYRLWWPVWQDCVRRNIGGAAEWGDGVGNRWMAKLSRAPDEIICG